MSVTTKYINKEVLIDLVREQPVLWDRSLEIYKDKQLRNAAWIDVCKALTEDFDQMNPTEKHMFKTSIVKTWGQTRDCWVRSMNLRKKARKAGSVSRPYIYHKQMLFLKDVISTNENRKRMADDTESDDSDDEEKSVAEEITLQTSSDDQDATVSSRDIEYKERPVVQTQVKTEIEELPTFVNVPRYQVNYSDPQEDRCLAFFKSIQPTLSMFNDDQILQFQSGVISLLQNIKKDTNI